MAFLPNALYDTYLGGRGSVFYNDSPDVEYPDATQTVVFGTAYLPRVYGLDLTSFEVASSGSVAMTLNDIHSLDFSREITESNVHISTLCNDNLMLSVAEKAVYVEFDAASNDLNIYAASNVKIVASNSFSVYTKDMIWDVDNMVFNAKNDIKLLAGSNVMIDAKEGYVNITADNSNVVFLLSNNDAFLTADSNITFKAIGGDFLIESGNDFSLIVDSNVNMSATDGYMKLVADDSNVSLTLSNYEATLYAKSNVFIQAEGGDFRLESGNDLSMIVDSNVNISATDGYMKLVADDSNVSLTLSNYEATFYAKSNVFVQAEGGDMRLESGNDFSLIVDSNVNMSATDGYMKLVADDSNVSLTLSNYEATLYAKSNVFVQAEGGDFRLESGNDLSMIVDSNINISATDGYMKLVADDSNVSLTLSNYEATFYAKSNVFIQAEGGDFRLESGNDLSMIVDSNVNISATDGYMKLVADDSNVSLTLSNYEATFYAKSNVFVQAEGGDMRLESGNDTVISANSNLYMAAQDGYAYLITDNSNVMLTLSNNDMDVFAMSNVDITAKQGDFTLTAGNDAYLTADSNIYMAALNGYAYLITDNSNVMLTLSNNDMQLFAQSNVVITSSNTFQLRTVKDINMSSTENDNTQYVTLDNTSNVWKAGTTGTFEFNVDGGKVVTIDNSNLRINGNLIITGVVDTQNVTETNLYIEDKLMYLAYGPDNLANGTLDTDGSVNDKSGLLVAGLPAGRPIESASNYEKSIRWNHSTEGTLALGSSNVDNEAYWEVKGGALRLTHTKTTAEGNAIPNGEISFGFRINHLDEMELFKKYYHNGQWVTKRVAKFGTALVL
jgi:uncharacterized protein (DUF2345 family)